MNQTTGTTLPILNIFLDSVDKKCSGIVVRTLFSTNRDESGIEQPKRKQSLNLAEGEFLWKHKSYPIDLPLPGNRRKKARRKVSTNLVDIVLSPIPSSFLFGFHGLSTSRIIYKWDSNHPTVVIYTYQFLVILFNANR